MEKNSIVIPTLLPRWIFPLVLALGLTSCGKKDSSVDLVTFPLLGKVIAIDSVLGEVTIRHDAIPEYMPSMTMPFKVKDRGILRGLAAGDSVGATLAISRTESWLETLQVLRKGDRMNALTAEEVEMKHLYRDGDEIPNIELMNQDGRTIRLSDFRGKVLALTFVYTRCPLPDFCIRMSQRLAETERILKSTGQSTAGGIFSPSVSIQHSIDHRRSRNTGRTMLRISRCGTSEQILIRQEEISLPSPTDSV